MLTNKKALMLDMNSTFMFGEDRFGEGEDYSIHYKSSGGQMPSGVVNELIRNAFSYLEKRYPDENYRHSFPSVRTAILQTSTIHLTEQELSALVDTFAFHEHGYIPDYYVQALHQLKKRFTLALVIDIWSPKTLWLETFKQLRIDQLFSAASFSSDHGMVKPSPKPFELVVQQLNIPRHECVVIGDSARRDLGGACAAGLECILVGGAEDEKALASVSSLLDISTAYE